MNRELIVVALAALCVGACTVTSHPLAPAGLGTVRAPDALHAVLERPGPLHVETVVSSDWEIDRAGLINLEHPRAEAARLTDGAEPIQLYFHVIEHPTRGTFIIDTGIEQAQRDAPERAVLRGLAASAMNAERLRVRQPLGEWLRKREVKLAGVLLTHLHADHVMGLPDVPRGTPLYVGPGETRERALMNIFVQPLIDDYLAGHAPLHELAFAKGAPGDVLDLFGDGSLWVLHTPGHTPGSVAYLARTVTGPVLFAGDTCHTAWGWEHDVEPGTFTSDHGENAKSLAMLRGLQREHPALEVRLGHQPYAGKAGGHMSVGRK